MRYSILLPTRNRLGLLREAMVTVLRQDYSDWEIVVSDNCSDDDVGGYVRSLDDPRVNYVRTDRVLPVTENWNNALAHSSGDYFLMLGDDDGLLDGYFTELDRSRARFGDPDLVYSRTLQFAHPGVLPDYPNGYLALVGLARFFRERPGPYVLGRAEAVRLAERSMRFELAFDFNMQFATIRRGLAMELGGPDTFFRSTFPDYYAMNLLFLRARRIVVHPRPLTIVGVSPRSYGFYRANDRVAEGMRMLSGFDEDALQGGIVLPGDDIRAGWLDAAKELESFTDGALHVDRRRLDELRAIAALLGYRHGAVPFSGAMPFLRSLPLKSQILLAARVAAFLVLSRPLSAGRRAQLMARIFKLSPFYKPEMTDAPYTSVADIFATGVPVRWRT
ncbi:MAG: glycosyltransferase family 2 protein [Gaiellaceae bacterium]